MDFVSKMKSYWNHRDRLRRKKKKENQISSLTGDSVLNYGVEHRDRLSELPDSLIYQIISFMSIRDAVSTTFLSKHWNNLWRNVPCLNIRESISEENGVDTVGSFVHQALMLWKGRKIVKFEIDIENFDLSLAGHVNVWVRFAVEREVEELNIHLSFPPKGILYNDDGEAIVYWAPWCLESCSSMRKLSLVGCYLSMDVTPPWNQLKSLKIESFSFSEVLINRILSGSPQLEVFELSLVESYENLNIRSSSLKELKIHKKGLDTPYASSLPLDTVETELSIGCPNLEVLQMSGYLYAKCSFFDFPSLIDATFGFRPCIIHPNGVCTAYELLGETLRQFFSTIQRAEKVTLSTSCEVLMFEKKYLLLPLLPNVKFLRLVALYTDLDDITGMVDLLRIFPNIKMLVIEARESISFQPRQMFNVKNYRDFDANLSKSSPPLQLKSIQIISAFDDASIFYFMRFLLKHCWMLEKLVIQVTQFSDRNRHERLFKVAEALLNMPKSSPNVAVIFKKD